MVAKQLGGATAAYTASHRRPAASSLVPSFEGTGKGSMRAVRHVPTENGSAVVEFVLAAHIGLLFFSRRHRKGVPAGRESRTLGVGVDQPQ